MASILIVEDMAVQAKLLEYHLDALGHTHKTAENGKKALEVLDNYRPDLIISDVQMPGMNGLDLCTQIKASADLQAIPVILLTANDSPMDVLQGINAMADGYLTKPYESELLQQTIDSAIARGAYLPETDTQRADIEFELAGETHVITASRHQMLNLFFSAYQSSTLQNQILSDKEQKLRDLNTKLSRTIEQLSASEERFRGLVQTIPDIVYKVDSEGCFTFVNDAIHRLGYHQSELIGHHFSEIIYEEDIDNVSAKSVLANMRSGHVDASTLPSEAPKLFDERRSSDRMTIGLQVRLKTKAGNPAASVEIQAISNQVIYVEVNSLGMYGESHSADRQYIGTVGVIRDISDRIQAQEAMRMAKESADAANKAKSDFLSSMSHELRTPLNAILGFGQLLDSPENPLNEDQLMAVGHIMDGGEHLLGLINEVLDLAKVESGTISISMEKVDPLRAIEPCLLMATSLAEKHGITIHNDVRTDGETPWILADLTRFKQILINLLSNAVKYNRPGGTATLDMSETDDGMVRFTVTDTGPGIPKDKQDLVFRPFQRLGKEVSAIEGSGIGLSICRELVQRMHGRIGFQSEPGQGSQFWVDFAQTGKLDDHAIGNASNAAMNTIATENDIAFENNKVVLYIEDNPANLQLMTRVFRDVPKCTLLTSPDAESGLVIAQEKLPDLILMDIHLPGMSGIEALSVLQETKATQHIPVIAITAAAMEHDRQAGMDAGFIEYLTKPFNIAEILKTVVSLLTRDT